MENFMRFQNSGKDITNSSAAVGHKFGFNFDGCSGQGPNGQGLPVYCPPQVHAYSDYDTLGDQ